MTRRCIGCATEITACFGFGLARDIVNERYPVRELCGRLCRPLRRQSGAARPLDGGNMIEKLIIAIAWRLPRRLAYWCAIRVGAHATQGKYGDQVVPDLKFMDALQRWD